MSRARILYLDEDGLSAYRPQGELWLVEKHFSRAADDQEAFTAYLEQHKNSTFHLLANLPGEEILSESIPALRGQDRQALIERRLEQHFPVNPLRTAISLGRSKENPPKEKWLLAALPQAALFNPWLRQIEASDTRLSGIYSLTQLMPSLLSRYAPLSGCQLFFLRHKQQLHQTFLVDGQLCFSRIIPNSTGDASELMQEAAKLQQYLLNQHLLARDENSQCFTLAGDEMTPPEVPVDNFRFVQFPDQNAHEALFLDALNNKPPTEQFASAALRQAYRQARWRFAATVLSGLIFIASLGLSSQKILLANTLDTEIGQAQIKEKTLKGQLTETGRNPGTETLSLNALRQITRHYEELIQQQSTPLPVFQALSQILEQHPAIDLDKLEWTNSTDRENLLITGHVLAAGPAFEQFLAALRVDRDRQVNLLHPPFAEESLQNLRGIAPERPPAAPGNFVIAWQRKP
jgi:hypothetical protein